MACSRPPEPMTKIFIKNILAKKVIGSDNVCYILFFDLYIGRFKGGTYEGKADHSSGIRGWYGG
ncbi:hypothetical protein FACS1894110_09600 [Spirochaetia bacterium]|nr:hypothetical protein FACS1894110_09600 [Spirochaetia bacterium]